MVPAEVPATHKAHRILPHRVAARIQRPRHHIHPLHPHPVAKLHRPPNRHRRLRRHAFPRPATLVRRRHRIQPAQRRHVVIPKPQPTRQARPPARPAQPHPWLHHRPSQLPSRLRRGLRQRIWIDLRIVQPQQPPKPPLHLETHHLQQGRTRRAQPVHHHHPMRKGRIRLHIV